MAKYAYINSIILDGTEDMEPQTEKMILTDGQFIESVTDQKDDLAGYQIVDLAGKYIMPGLVNFACSSAGRRQVKEKSRDPVKLVKLVTSNALFKRIGLSMCQSMPRCNL